MIAIFELPAFSLFDRTKGPPHRHRVEATHTNPAAPGRAAIKYTVASNWKRTTFWAWAIFPGSPNMRASNMARTTAFARAAEWIEAVRAGHVAIERHRP